MEINEMQDPDYEVVTISNLGFVDPYGNEGLVILHSDDKREFHMRAFSGEVSQHIASFLDDEPNAVPTIYKMLEDICEANELLLVKVKIYESGDALRANLYFTGKKDLVLRNYRASDAVALAVYYKIPILVRNNMLKSPIEETMDEQERARDPKEFST
jgi:bifunctional DNase/RNase